MSNRTLLIVFVSVLTLFLAGKIFRGNRTRSFDPLVVKVDTSKADRIKFISAGPDVQEFELIRNGSTWEAIQGDKKVFAQSSSVQSILSALAEMNAKRVVTKEKSKYQEYEIDDTQASKIEVWEGKKQVASLLLGGFRFDQVARTASSYVRKDDQPEVYLIDGFAGMGLKARFEQFRDKKLVKATADDLSALTWDNDRGEKQSIVKEEGIWYYAGMEALDSTKITSYLSGLVAAQGSSFSDINSTQGLELIEKITLSGNNMTEPTVLYAFVNQDTLKPFLIHSTANPDAIFTSDSLGLYKRIFTDLRQFWPDGQ